MENARQLDITSEIFRQLDISNIYDSSYFNTSILKYNVLHRLVPLKLHSAFSISSSEKFENNFYGTSSPLQSDDCKLSVLLSFSYVKENSAIFREFSSMLLLGILCQQIIDNNLMMIA